MAGPNQVTGRVTITVDGQRLESREGAVLNTGGVEREPVVGDTGVHGFTEKTVAPTVECSVSHKAGTRLTDLNAINNATLVFATDTGVDFVLRGAWLSKPADLKSGGEVSLAFSALSCEEL